jgi:hypothetical protein
MKKMERIKKRMVLDWKNSAVHKRVEHKEEDEISEVMLNIEYGENRSDIKQCAPDIGIKKSIHIDLGGIDCSFDYIGGNHSDDSSVLFVHQEKLIFLGDILYIHQYEKTEIEALYTSFKSYDVHHYVDSHNKTIYDNNELDRLFKDMENPKFYMESPSPSLARAIVYEDRKKPAANPPPTLRPRY